MNWCIKALCLFISTSWLALAGDWGEQEPKKNNELNKNSLEKRLSIINFNLGFGDKQKNKFQKIEKKSSTITFNLEEIPPILQ